MFVAVNTTGNFKSPFNLQHFISGCSSWPHELPEKLNDYYGGFWSAYQIHLKVLQEKSLKNTFGMFSHYIWRNQNLKKKNEILVSEKRPSKFDGKMDTKKGRKMEKPV